jgi:dihydrofolate reductase
MGKIVVNENITLDGHIQDQTGGVGWFDQVMATIDRAEWARLLFDEAVGAQALLLGRRSDEWFAARWASRGGEWADRLNTMPKYVVSSTIGHAAWNNSTVLAGDVVKEVSKLKRELDGDIVVYGSGQLVRTLLARDLVDELRLMVFPVVLGTGTGIFGESTGRKPMRLLSTRTVSDGLASLSYELLAAEGSERGAANR